ncbi:DUF3054 domain-containing protein [Rhodococcus sp. HNM0569]|uniref:DUF3054 family protein n=1 Tax=Rhodococcus sp. HNM0569 TaxID=2716340 RepID=UPI00146AC055|nr:DUF3054 domain-containing protein [Rhodococcus sp. HNM0569]
MNKRLLAFLLDVVVIVIFAAIGRRSHGEANALVGLATTAWPFLLGTVVGWGATFALYRDKFDALRVVPTGVIVWLCTLVVGMLARVVVGQGTAFSFVIVAAVFTGLFLIGWRAVAAAFARRRATR